ncbi:MAG: YaaA family protein [Spirochaetaceae bacterium]|nr:YaaA family protein [Spirochaetaceae bacterium]
MLILLSPTKQMDFSRADRYSQTGGEPEFLKEALLLNRELKKLDLSEIKKLMKTSDNLSKITRENIQKFHQQDTISHSALFAYRGTVFQSLDAGNFTPLDLDYTSKHLRILSGLYGLLKPDHMVYPYRLEMKTPLVNEEGENLYHFWKPRITDSLNREEGPIVNLASGEYTKAIDIRQLHHQMISLSFKEREAGKVRTVGMYSKVARGLMARHIIHMKIIEPDPLKNFDLQGYIYDPELSSESDWIFVRNRS